jgi:hypothetical protein
VSWSSVCACLLILGGARAAGAQSAGQSGAQSAGQSGAQGGAQASPPAWLAYLEGKIAQARRERLWQRTTWLRLGHYRPRLFGGYVSEADGKDFFVAREGKTDPAAELEATLRAFFLAPEPLPPPPPQDPKAPPALPLDHPFCRFPARLLWLTQELGLDFKTLPARPCPRFAEFYQLLEPDSFTLVFSSYYLNNPASAFGHTFLRVNRRHSELSPRQELLDYGIDFSAGVDTDNPVLYALKGLMGFFPGVFRKIPYYYKVREYNDFELRDLWEYELDLKPREVELVIAHLWELGSTHFNYYYLTENCSYHVLGALEVARPELELLDELGWPVIPADTVKALYKGKNKGLVRAVYYRPSAGTLFRQRVGTLSGDEIEALAEVMTEPKAPLPSPLTIESQVRVLDAALDLVDSKFSRELVKDEKERDRDVSEVKQTLLERRARLLVVSEPFEIVRPLREQPHHGHASKRLGIGPGYERARGFDQRLDFRVALHDLSDPPRGYPDSTEIEFLPMQLRYFVERPRLWLEHISLIRVRSLTPWTRFALPLSWGVRFGASRLYDVGGDGHLAAQFELGGGGTVAAGGGAVMLFLLGSSEISALSPIRGGLFDLPLRASLGPDAGLRLRLSESLVTLLQGRWHWLPEQTPGWTYKANASLRWEYQDDFALSLDGRAQRDEKAISLMSMIYF